MRPRIDWRPALAVTALLGAACGGAPPAGPGPPAAPAPQSPASVVQLVSGDHHTCALRSDGRIVCWMCQGCGWPDGHDPQLPPSVPRLIEGLTDVVAIWAFDAGTCARRESGEVSCFGHERFGDFETTPGENRRVSWKACTLVDGRSECVEVPPGGRPQDPDFICHNRRAVDHEIRADACGPPVTVVFDDVSCETSDAIRRHEPTAGSRLEATWGSCKRRGTVVECEQQTNDGARRVEIAEVVSAAELVLLDTDPTICGRWPGGAVDCFTMDGVRSRLADDAERVFGGERICVWRRDGMLSCTSWGLGHPLRWDKWRPLDAGELVDIARLESVERVEMPGNLGCAVPAEGPPACWRWEQQFYDGGELYYYEGEEHTPAHPVGTVGDPRQLSLGAGHACALDGDGLVRCFGRPAFPAQPDPAVRRTGWQNPTLIEGLNAGGGIAAGAGHVCAIDAGRLACLGANDAGQLGDGTREARLDPAPVADLGEVIGVAAGDRHTCALLAGGGVSCFGTNTHGQLGDGTDEGRVTPTPVSGVKRVVEVQAAGERTCVRERGGAVRCWGRGIGSKPTRQRQLRGVTALALARDAMCGLRRGKIVCVHENPRLDRVRRAEEVAAVDGRCLVERDGTAACFGQQYTWGDSPDDAWIELVARSLKIDEPVRAVTMYSRSSAAPRILALTRSGKLVGAKYPMEPLCPPDNCGTLDLCAWEDWVGHGPDVWPIAEAAELEVVDATVGAEFTCVVGANGEVTCWGWTEIRPVEPPPITDHWPTTVIDVTGVDPSP